MTSSLSSTRSVPPPSHQEVTRKLSVHSAKPQIKKPSLASVVVSGTESDSDSAFSPDAVASSPMTPSLASAVLGTASSQPPLSSIAERRSQSGEESEEGTDDEEGGWRVQDYTSAATRGALDETVIKAGYLWKKGERRKTWKKRWFVLRPAHLAFYKTSAEYKLLRLLELTDVHSCTPVVLKKHQNTFGIVSPVRTFYLQAETQAEMQDWVRAINEAKTQLLSTSTRNSVSSAPIPIPNTPSTVRGPFRLSSSPSQSSPYGHQLTSSESDDASPNTKGIITDDLSGRSPATAARRGSLALQASRLGLSHEVRITAAQLAQTMDTKPHREIPLSMILDALEYELPAHRHHPTVTSPSATSPPVASSSSPDDGDGAHSTHTFKVVTTKRTLLLCAPSEEEEIKWLSAIRALIARRSTQGVLPGDATPPVTSPPNASSPASGPAPTGKRRDSIARRLSLSGGGTFGVSTSTSNASTTVPYHAEGASAERQSSA
ncbi:hypothetical protein BN946_scf184939.g71 [Trametes cinnabarina]|uniref:PH domain-containing protein n=1 Tax=Pycnoporus cinnabarinus TaxID=5643 RepID=A0A060SBJ9_PYCCI|nr:hypothetical protein BN946_scf184939.g71 [Trametes cinnabarina]